VINKLERLRLAYGMQDKKQPVLWWAYVGNLLDVAEAATQVLEQDFTTPGGMSGYRLIEKALKPLLEENE